MIWKEAVVFVQGTIPTLA